MLNYTQPSKSPLKDLPHHPPHTSKTYSPLDPKFLPTRPAPLTIKKKTSKDFGHELPLTPKSTRITNYNRSTLNGSFNRTCNNFNDLSASRKNSSFTTPVKTKPIDSLNSSFHLEQK